MQYWRIRMHLTYTVSLNMSKLAGYLPDLADIYFSFSKRDFHPAPNKNCAKLKKKLLDRASYHGRGNFITINLTFSNSATYHLNYIQSIQTLYACKSLHFKNKLCYHLKNTYLYNKQGLSRRDILSPVFKWEIFLPFYFRKKTTATQCFKRTSFYVHPFATCIDIYAI